MAKKVVLSLSVIIAIILVGVGIYYFIDTNKDIDVVDNYINNNNNNDESMLIGNNINLDDYDNDITIFKEGTYDIKGSFTNSIIINASGNVILNLNNVNIKNNNAAGIINKSSNSLTINLVDETINTIEDGGRSEYDAAIYSNSHLIIEGSGTLNVVGNQTEGEGIATEDADITINGGIIHITSKDDGLNAGGDNGGTITINNGSIYIDSEGDGIDSNNNAIINNGTIFVMASARGGDAGIDTDNGYIINGGTLIALGSDMLEAPQSSSKQNSLSLTLNSSISANTNVTLVNSQKEIISFKPTKQFRTIIISTNNLINDTYNIYYNTNNTGELINGIYSNNKYSGGTMLKVNNTNEFIVSKTVNNYGSSKR